MFSKSDFTKKISNFTENTDKLYSAYSTFLSTNKSIFTNEFYESFVCDLLQKFLDGSEVTVSTYGFGDEVERKIVCFSKDIVDISCFDSKARILKISYNDKFIKLSHRDFLGSILSLGLTRCKMGDLVLQGNSAYVPVIENCTDYIVDNLKKVRNVYVSVEFELFNRLPQKKIEVLYKIVSSLRLDSVVSVLIGLSREKSKTLIREGRVKVNGVLSSRTDSKIYENNLITISGFGKFKIRENLGTTAKDKIKIAIDKFV